MKGAWELKYATKPKGVEESILGVFGSSSVMEFPLVVARILIEPIVELIIHQLNKLVIFFKLKNKMKKKIEDWRRIWDLIHEISGINRGDHVKERLTLNF